MLAPGLSTESTLSGSIDTLGLTGNGGELAFPVSSNVLPSRSVNARRRSCLRPSASTSDFASAQLLCVAASFSSSS
ncbi:hypothetical protein [Lentzea indica]|uniref:hypothetical protein n=1 Tax=Lentzea indica TaxID=2604800 RepID=UPI001CB74DDF|nr:hypothetical protein [Lentzea indica]